MGIYLSLFLTSFLSATIIPFSSEAIFASCFYLGYDPFWIVFFATAGNWLGGLTNYFLGVLGNIEKIKKWTGVKEEKISGLKIKIRRYGYWLALLSWTPLIGDPLMVVLGVFKVNWKMVFILSLTGKLIRYIILYQILRIF